MSDMWLVKGSYSFRWRTEEVHISQDNIATDGTYRSICYLTVGIPYIGNLQSVKCQACRVIYQRKKTA
jgi:hypothetical protein